MKTLMAVLFLLSSAAAFANKSAMTYKIDPSQSKIEWLGKKVTGQHNGTIGIKSGNLVFTGDALTGGDIVVDMNTLACTDITDADTNGKFSGHMKSADFFDVTKYPEAKLVIKGSKKTDKGLEVTGDLTMKGKTQPVTFLADLKKDDKMVNGKTQLVLDRTKWDLKYGSGKFFQGLGDKMIYDDFTLTISITAKK